MLQHSPEVTKLHKHFKKIQKWLIRNNNIVNNLLPTNINQSPWNH